MAAPEIVAEFENWRRVRDSDGEEGWILQNMLAGKRTAEIAPWKQGQNVQLMQNPKSGAGVVADSVPTAEYEETVNKSKGVLRALGLAAGLKS